MSQNKISIPLLFAVLLITGFANNLNAPHDAYGPAKTASRATQTITIQKPVQISENTPTEFEARTNQRKKLETALNVLHASWSLCYLSLIVLDPFMLFGAVAGAGALYAGTTSFFPKASKFVSRQNQIETYFVTITIQETRERIELQSHSPQEISEKAQLCIVQAFKKNSDAQISVDCNIKLFKEPLIHSLSSFSITPWTRQSAHVRQFSSLEKYVFKKVGLKLEDRFVVTPASGFLRALATIATIGALTFVACASIFGITPLPAYYFGILQIQSGIPFLIGLVYIGVPSYCVMVGSIPFVFYYHEGLA